MKAVNRISMRMFVQLFFMSALILGTFTSCEKAVAAKEDPEMMKVYGESVAELTPPPFVR